MPAQARQAKAAGISAGAGLKIAQGATQIGFGVLTGASSGYSHGREPWWGIV
jgi:hypothetical protein